MLLPAALGGLLLAAGRCAAGSASIFGEGGARSPVPQNTAQYMLDLESQDVYLHYCGDGQLFSLRLSPNLRQHLQKVAAAGPPGDMPMFRDVGELSSEGIFDWSSDAVPVWSPKSGADTRSVFYGREVRDVADALYGNSIHLSLGPEEDPEGWTPDEMEENRQFAEAIRHGSSVGAADAMHRQFRTGVPAQLGGSFADRFGDLVTTKAHRFAWQMYTVDSQDEERKPGRLFFEMFPGGSPPTGEVPFLEAEDGCKGTPTPREKPTADTFLGESEALQSPIGHGAGVRAAAAAAAAAALLASLAFAATMARAARARRSSEPLFGPQACE